MTLLELAQYKGTTVQTILVEIEKITGQKLLLKYDNPLPTDYIKCIAPELVAEHTRQINKRLLVDYQEETLELFNSGDEGTILGFVKAKKGGWITVKLLNNEVLTVSIEKFARFSIAIGYIVEFYFQDSKGAEGELAVAYCMSRSNWSLMKLRQAYRHKNTIKGKVLWKFDNGLIVNVFGRKAVIYQSQIDYDKIKDITSFIGKVLDVRVMELKENTDGSAKIILSRKAVLKAEIEKLQIKELSQLEIGKKYEGVVTEIIDSGVFVKFGNLTGFIPKSLLAMRRINHPSEVVKINDPIQVSIFNIKEENKKTRITLEYKQCLWESVISQVERGAIIVGNIRKIEDYGIFVEIVPGLDGLLHLSEMTRRKYSEFLLSSEIINREIKVVIIGVDEEEHKINLSLLPLAGNKWNDIETRYQVGCTYPAKIVDVRENEVWAELEEDIEGVIFPNELKWPKTNFPQKELSFDQEVLVIVKDIDVNEKRVILSLRECTPNPWALAMENIEKGTIIKVRVEDIDNRKITVCTVDEFRLFGSIPLSEISWFKNREELKMSDLPTQGEIIEARIIKWIPEKFIMYLSLRQLTDDPWDKIEIGAKINGIISEVIENVGLKIILSNGLLGISQELNLAEYVGKSLNFKVIGYNRHSHEINLSHRQLASDKLKDEIVRSFFATNIFPIKTTSL